jgi:hypothetical protein
MRTRVWTFALGAVLTLALAGLSHAGIERSGVGRVETIECQGQAVEVSGTSHDLTLLGECPHVEVNGVGNTVRVELARHIEVSGINNKVIWSQGISGRPQIEQSGVNNIVRQGSVAGAKRFRTGTATSGLGGESVSISGGGDSVTIGTQRKGGGGSVTIESGTGDSVTIDTSRRGGGDSVTIASGTGESLTVGTSHRAAAQLDSVVINDNERTQRIDCTSGDVTVNGNLNTLTLVGECQDVGVNGNGNVLRIEAAAAISTLGNENSVTWSRGVGAASPRISNSGTRNSISRRSE